MAMTVLSSDVRYCRTCGDALRSGARCHRCGSRGEASVLSSISALANRKADPWMSRYAPDIKATPQQSRSFEVEVDTEASHGESKGGRQDIEGLKEENWLRSCRNPASASLSGVGMPSSISRDLRLGSISSSPGSSSPQRSNLSSRQAQLPSSDQEATEVDDSIGSLPALKGHLSHLPHSASQPLLQHLSGGTLSKVCGSVIEPANSRNKWACSDCSSVFARDSTVYVPPASAIGQGGRDRAFYCKACYTQRYALGVCARSACQQPVLGTTKETGAFVKAGEGKVYHGICFRCHSCDAGGGQPPIGNGVEVMLDMEGRPSCEDCFGAAPRRREVPPESNSSYRLASTALSPSLGTALTREGTGGGFPFQSSRWEETPARKRGEANMSAAIAELSHKFEKPTGRGRQVARGCTSVEKGETFTVGSSCALPSKTTLEDPAEGSTGSTTDKIACTLVPSSPARTHTRSGFPRPRNRGEGDVQAAAISSESGFLATLSPTPSRTRTAEGNREKEISPSRSSSPVPATDIVCAACGKGAFDGPDVYPTAESPGVASMVTLPPASSSDRRCPPLSRASVSGFLNLSLHPACFRCDVCNLAIAGGNAFVRLAADPSSETQPVVLPLFAHPSCAPPARMEREHQTALQAGNPSTTAIRPQSASPSQQQQQQSSSQHPTSRSLPRPSETETERKHVAVHSFLRRAQSYEVERQRQERQKAKDSENHPRSSPHRTSGTIATDRSGKTTTMAMPTTCTTKSASTYSTPFQAAEASQRFRPTGGAAPPTRFSLITAAGFAARNFNPAAGMFATRTSTSSSPQRSFPAPRSPSPVRPTVGVGSSREVEEGQRSSAGTLSTLTSMPLMGVAASPPKVDHAVTPRTLSPVRYGGMLSCAGCAGRLTALESIPGPAGSHWHRKCLTCGGAGEGAAATTATTMVSRRANLDKASVCGRQLDSFAKVRHEDGAVRCTECFRAGR